MNIESPDKKSSVVEARRNIAEAHGKSYLSFLETLLDSTVEDKTKRAEEIIAELPEAVRPLYQKALSLFIDSTKKNEIIISHHKGERAKFLLEDFIADGDLSQESRNDLLALVSEDDYSELIPGVPVLSISSDLRNRLFGGGFSSPVGYVAAIGHGEGQPSYMLNPKLTKMKFRVSKEVEKSVNNFHDRLKIHELHHFVWGLLENEDFARKCDESDPEVARLFLLGRHEFAAHLIGDSGLFDALISNKSSRENETLKRKIETTQSFICFAISLAEKTDMDRLSFLYPIMSSTNFDDLKKRILEMVPVEKMSQADILNRLYSLFQFSVELGRDENTELALGDLVKSLDLSFTKDEINALCSEKLKKPSDGFAGKYKDLSLLEKSNKELDVLKKFVLTITGLPLDESD